MKRCIFHERVRLVAFARERDPPFSPRRGGREPNSPALSLNTCPSYARLNVATCVSFLNAMYAREGIPSLFTLRCDFSSESLVNVYPLAGHAPLRTQLSGMIRLPGDRVVRDPRLNALPKDLFGQVGRETADDRLETFCAIRRGLRSGFFLFLLARGFEIGRGHRDRVIDTSCSSRALTTAVSLPRGT